MTKSLSARATANAYRKEWRRNRDARLAEECNDGRLADDPLAALLKQIDPDCVRLRKLQTVRAMIQEGELSTREIAMKTGVQGPMIAKIRSMLPVALKCACGRPASHTGKCAARTERTTILNTPGMALTAFEAGKCERFLSKRPELADAVEYFSGDRADTWPEVKEPLGKFQRLGSMTEQEISRVVDTFRVARQRAVEVAQGIISHHVGVIGQRILRLRVKMMSMVKTKNANARFRAYLKKKAVDGGGNILTWIEQAKHESPDGWFFMDCTVREHVFFEGQNQTVMEYCKPQPEIEVEGPAKEIVRALACREDLSAAELDQLQIAGTALGDEAAFTAFVNRRRPQLVRAAASVVGPFDAEDAAQLTLIHLWGIASRFRFLCEVEAWIHTMARRRAYRWLRASQVRATLSLEERMAENHWEPVSRDMPPWGGLFMREIEEEEARLAAQNL